MRVEQVIKRPLILTEKGSRIREASNKYLFEVALGANKLQIKDAVERLFNVSVLDVNTLIVRGRPKRMGRQFLKTRNWKKAIVTVKAGETIDLFEGA